jgi:uncharacterized alkaline shock family protein YloU
MIVYALVGKSGTGKSYKAQYVAGMYNIEFILDDGLLIRGAKVIAGISAKREDTRIAAVRRAIYLEHNHRKQVMEAINSYGPEKVLIIGTSKNMIRHIMEALELGSEYKLINIEDVSSEEEIEAASRARRSLGKHVIPVPTFEIKKQFSGYFLDSFRQFVRKSENQVEYFEKTIVRPTFSYLGSFEIKDGALKTLVKISAVKIENVYKSVSVDIKSIKTGIIITIGVILILKEPLQRIANSIAEAVKRDVEYMTGINVLEVNISIKSIKISQE